MKPVGDRLLVKVDSDQEKKVGALIVVTEEKQARGTVKAVGNKTEELSVGDVVYYSPYAGSVIEVDDEEYLILRETDVLLIV